MVSHEIHMVKLTDITLPFSHLQESQWPQRLAPSLIAGFDISDVLPYLSGLRISSWSSLLLPLS